MLALLSDGLPRNEIRKKNPRLCAAIDRQYGGLTNYFKHIGVTAPKKLTPRKHRKEDIDDFILKLIINGKNYSSNYLKTNGTREEKKICDSACKLYGSWNNALLANDVEPIREYGKYTKEKVIEMFKRDHKSYNDYRKYERYIVKYFGDIGNLRKVIGFYEEPHNYELIPLGRLDEIVMDVYNDPNVERISTEVLDVFDKNIAYSIKQHYGSVATYFNGMDIDFLAKPVPFFWNENNLKRQLLRMIYTGHDVNYTAMANSHKGIIVASRKYFGGYRELFESCGLSYDDFRIDTDMASYYGHQFEAIVGELFDDLNYNYTKYQVDAPCHPDFVIGSHWIDAKLSQWSISRADNETINKYEPHCDKLTIVFLRGDKTIDKMISDKTRLVNVYHYVNMLPEHIKLAYTEKLNKIERDLISKAA